MPKRPDDSRWQEIRTWLSLGSLGRPRWFCAFLDGGCERATEVWGLVSTGRRWCRVLGLGNELTGDSMEAAGCFDGGSASSDGPGG